MIAAVHLEDVDAVGAEAAASERRRAGGEGAQEGGREGGSLREGRPEGGREGRSFKMLTKKVTHLRLEVRGRGE